LDFIDVSYAADFAFDGNGTFSSKYDLTIVYIILVLDRKGLRQLVHSLLGCGVLEMQFRSFLLLFRTF
jgi:hypothetical protein